MKIVKITVRIIFWIIGIVLVGHSSNWVDRATHKFKAMSKPLL